MKDSLVASIDFEKEVDIIKNDILKIELVYSALIIVSSVIFFVGLSGVMKIYKRLVWREPIFIKDDFFLGVKENGLGFIIFGFILGTLISIEEIVPILTSTFLQYVPIGLNLVLLFPIILIV